MILFISSCLFERVIAGILNNIAIIPRKVPKSGFEIPIYTYFHLPENNRFITSRKESAQIEFL